LGVIENATVEFKPGLNVITGETGAGKTMVLTALSLVLGGKTDSDLIRKASERLVVSGRFALSDPIQPSLKNLIEDNEIEPEEGELLLTRTLNSDGKSRASICGLNTTASILSQFGSELIEIHGQHGTLQLSKPQKQREMLDRFGGRDIQSLLHAYQDLLADFDASSKRLENLKRALRDRDKEVAELQELLGETKKLKPEFGELSSIDTEIKKLESVEEIRLALNTLLNAIDGEEQGANTSLGIARRAIQSVRDKDQVLDEAAVVIEEGYFALAELSSRLQAYLDDLAADPMRLEELLNRRAALRTYAKRFGEGANLEESLGVALERAEAASNRMKDLSGGEGRVDELEREQRATYLKLLDASGRLTDLRRQQAEKLDKEVTRELRDLAMPKAHFRCEVRESLKLEANGEMFDCSKFGRFGNDEVVMRFAAHSEGELLPISKAASGGELSRLMLALEVVVAETSPMGTYLFDEIDSGIGGKAALEVGRRLKQLAEKAQIIVVTHLAQVAIWGNNHLRVLKDSNGSITESSVTNVEGGERESEIARMLSGLEGSEHAQEHARELLDLVKS
jgi:DNA repair protein RecN (Recombination protein N)